MSDTAEDYYGPLLLQHLKSILESVLLLDEDYDVLLQRCNFKCCPSLSRRRPWEVLVGGMTVLVSWKCRQNILALSALVATILSIYIQRRDIVKRKQRGEIIDGVLKNFLKVRKLNTGVVSYLKIRKPEDYGGQVQAFLKVFTEQNKIHFDALLGDIEYLVKAHQELHEDFLELQQLNLSSLLTLEELNGTNCHLLAARVQDITTLLSSKFLNYLGLTLSNYLTYPNPPALEGLLDQQLPRVKLQLEQLHTFLQKQFDNLRYCAAQKVKISLANGSYFGRQLSGKLQHTIMGAVNNLSLIMEKSHTVLSKVHETDDIDDVKKLETTLNELRDHALTTYESLDVLCRFYGVLSQSYKPEHVDFSSANQNTHVEKPLNTLHYDDDSEVVEEDFELFIPADQEVEIVKKEVESGDQSKAYLGLMLTELKQSLQQHERFVAARSKRGAEQNEVLDAVEEAKLPQFNLNLLTRPGSNTRLIPAPCRSKLLPSKEDAGAFTPPQPPPPPIFQVASEYDKETTKTLFEGISTLSAQLMSREDVFGDDSE